MGGSSDPHVSIVVPAYNCERWLDRCLKSLSAQTLKTREIIVVDDGSTDSTHAIAERWAEVDPTIRIIRKPNGGCASARSAGLHAARGKFIGFIDADDWIDASMYEKLFSLASENRAEVAQAGFCKVFLPEERLERYDDQLGSGIKYFDTIDNETRSRLLMGQPSIWRRIYCRKYLQKNNIDFPVNLRNYDDLTFQFEVMVTVERFVATDEALYFYLLGHPDQTMSIRDERHFVHFQLFDYLRRHQDVTSDPLIRQCFKRIQFNSHHWSRTLLHEEYRKRHERLVAHDIFGTGSVWRSVKVLTDLLLYTYGRDSCATWIIKCWLLYMIGAASDPRVPKPV